MDMLQLQSVSKTFAGPAGPVRAIEDVTLGVAGGEFVAIRGPSGCGKSTLLLTAGALLRPDTGEVIVEGHNLYTASTSQRALLRATTIGFVFQHYHLLPYMTLLDNVLAPSLAGAALRTPRERAMQLLDKLGLADRARHTPAQLSAGERQRTALARALFASPNLLLADEPTGNLDPASAATILGEFEAFANAGGAVVMVTHDANAAARAGRVFWMQRGSLTSTPQAAGLTETRA